MGLEGIFGGQLGAAAGQASLGNYLSPAYGIASNQTQWGYPSYTPKRF
jgi:hypothetical protein